MNTLLLHPTDVLFFRDGRPMGGSLSGHGAAWPLPTVTNAALHAALWRADIKNPHPHRSGKNGQVDAESRDHKFGGVVSAGPFPVVKADGAEDKWLFPRPLDTGGDGHWWEPTFLPLKINFDREDSSLPKPLLYPVANTGSPSNNEPEPWWDDLAWRTYIEGKNPTPTPSRHKDSDFMDTESTFGIGIDPSTDTQDGERFYSAHYLRLRSDVEPYARIGLLARAPDKVNGDPSQQRELLTELFPQEEGSILVGGQQRTCSLEYHPARNGHPLPLPRGKTDEFCRHAGESLVKWTLLTPAIFPEIPPGTSQRGVECIPHCGGWLPNWVAEADGKVLLTDGPGKSKAKRKNGKEGSRIPATLVAAMVGKPIPVSGYALPHEAKPRSKGVPKRTLLAVPAGSVYYFKTKEPKKLAAALNWHGNGNGAEILHRRSTLFGEKGFGLGVCSSWTFHDGNCP